MQSLPTFLVTVIAVIPTSAFSPFSAQVRRSDPVLVRSVLDGDTIDVTTFGRVRLLGIDAPEIGRGFDTAAPFGHEARERLASLVLNRWVHLDQEGARLDMYSRHLAYVVREDGVFVNAVLVAAGLARVSARVPLSRLSELERAEAEAKTFRRGMWGEAPRIPSPSYTRPAGRRKSSTSGAKSRKPRKSTS